MRKKMKKAVAIALSCLMAVGNDGNKILFQYDGEKISLKEGWLYAKLIAAQYDDTYSSTYGKDFWNMEMGKDNEGKEQTFESYTKQQIISQLKQQIVLNKKADAYGCKLSAAKNVQNLPCLIIKAAMEEQLWVNVDYSEKM